MISLPHGKTLLVLAAVIIAVATLFYIQNRQMMITEKDILDECRISDIPEMQKCFTEKLVAYAQKTSFREALLALERAKGKRPDISYDCHFIAHELGKAAYSHFRDLARALEPSLGINVCTDGYYHHVFIEYTLENFAALKSGQALAESTCGLIAVHPEKMRLKTECYHALGHGIAAVYKYNLLPALKQCDSVADESGRFSCYGGVFMENGLLAHVDDTSDYPFFQKGDPFYPCRKVDKKYRGECYANSVQQYYIEARHIHPTSSRDIVDGAFALCREAPKEYQPQCFFGIGVYWGYKVNENCLRGENFDEQKFCIEGAASRYRRMGKDELSQFCNSLPAGFIPACL